MFKVEVHKADAWLRSSEVLTSGSSKAYKATFSFIHPIWNGFTKKAVFKAGSVVKEQLLADSLSCEIPWEVLQNLGAKLEVGVYGVDGIIYKSISGTYENPTELLYPPEQAVALFVKDGEEVPTDPEEPNPDDEYKEWVQPTGAHDAYSISAKVIYNGGKKYISQIEGNTTVPGSDERWWKEVVEN